MSTEYDFTGAWKISFWYPSNHHEGEDVANFEAEAYQNKNKIVFNCKPNKNNSHMTVNLDVDGVIATGRWYENTDPQGEHEGLTYTGAMQLLVSEDGKKLEGQWVGVGREKQADGNYEARTYNGRWLIERP